MTYSPVPTSGPSWWSRFSADPRLHGALRASDADRDLAVAVVQDAYAEGRLTEGEHTQRIGQALAARTLGEFVPLLNDLPESATTSAQTRTPAVRPPGRPRLLDDRGFRAWLSMAVLFNVIWLVASVAGGFHLDYYWPIWPMLGTGIPVLMGLLNGGRDRDEAERRRLNREAAESDRGRHSIETTADPRDVRRNDWPGSSPQVGGGPGL